MNTALMLLVLLAPTAGFGQPAAPDVRDNVDRGLKWLASQQQKDGSWAGVNTPSPTLVTSHAGLALLMEGSTLKNGKYSANLQKAVEWFEKISVENGSLVTDPNEAAMALTSHASALLFLASVYDVDDDSERAKRLAELIKKAITYAINGQSSRGGWGYIGGADGNDFDDTNSTALVMQGLFAARKAGFAVPQKSLDRGTQYLVNATNKEGGIIYSTFGNVVPMGNDGQLLGTASAAAGMFMSNGARPGEVSKWVRWSMPITLQQWQYLSTAGSYGLLQQFHMARVCFALGENGHRKMDPAAREADQIKWSGHRTGLFKALKAMQTKDGNWPDEFVGPSYSTAIALLMLQLDNEYLPIFAR